MGPHKIAETDPDDDVACAVVRDVIAVGADLLSRGGTLLLPFFFFEKRLLLFNGMLGLDCSRRRDTVGSGHKAPNSVSAASVAVSDLFNPGCRTSQNSCLTTG